MRNNDVDVENDGGHVNESVHLLVAPSGHVLSLPKTVVLDATQHQQQHPPCTTKNDSFHDFHDDNNVHTTHSISQGEGEEDADHVTSNLHHYSHCAQDPTNIVNSHNNVLLRHVSLELLNPTHDSDRRKSSIVAAIFNLIATVCGGGVLSLPLAFKRAGIIPTTLLMIYATATTDFSLYILISCARRTGGRSYSDITQSAFGYSASFMTTILLFLHTFFTLIAYMVLVRDIWTPVISNIVPHSILRPLLEQSPSSGQQQQPFTSYSQRYDHSMDDWAVSSEGSNIILFFILIFGSPLLVKQDLHALRHTCYVGFCSCTLLMLAVVYRAIQKSLSTTMMGPMQDSVFDHNQATTTTSTEGLSRLLQQRQWHQHEGSSSSSSSSLSFSWLDVGELNWWSTNIEDWIFAYPIVVLAFLCSFNVLSVHCSLVNPTRQRVKIVLDNSMLLCCIIFYLVGLGGYVYALADTTDNILLNFPISDRAVLLGRMGYCCTLLFALPMVTLPCREALLSIPGQIRDWRADTELTHKFEEVETKRKEGAHLVVNGVDFDESEPLIVTDDPEELHGTMLMKYGSNHDETVYLGPHQQHINHMNSPCSTTNAVYQDRGHSPGSATTIEEADRSSWLMQESSSDDETASQDDCVNERNWEILLHFGSTFAIVGACYVAAICVPGVAFVWSIVGSSCAMMIGFIIPTACYLKIRTHKKMNPRALTAWILLIVSIIAAFICTRQALSGGSK